ncbi:MAG: ATP-binding protein [bacterium]
MIKRNLTQKLLTALKDSPVVLLQGARQTGKSTLVKSMIENDYPAKYVTFDDISILSAAKADPQGFIDSFEGNVAIDEIQRAPEIFLAIKRAVDLDRRPGRFILTGSANALLLPKVSESLTGRVELLTLYPFSQNEISNTNFNLVDILFNEKLNFDSSRAANELLKRILLGGYPEIKTRANDERRNAWYKSYITTITQRDVRDISNIEGLTQFPSIMSLLAERAGSLLNFAELSRSAAIPQTTLKRYVSLLQSIFLLYFLPAYSQNLSKRIIKTPKVYLYDTGLLAFLIGANAQRVKDEPRIHGMLVENFALMELLKQASWSNQNLSFYHFRTTAGQEVYFVLEIPGGEIVGIEVKATQTPKADMFNGLKLLREETVKKFVRGILLYNGNTIIPFDKNLLAIPISYLW